MTAEWRDPVLESGKERAFHNTSRDRDTERESKEGGGGGEGRETETENRKRREVGWEGRGAEKEVSNHSVEVAMTAE